MLDLFRETPALALHLGLMLGVCLVSGVALVRHRAMRFSTAGCWAWLSFGQVYVLAQLGALVSSGPGPYKEFLLAGVPESYMYQAAVVTALGMAVFWFAYFRKPRAFARWLSRLPEVPLDRPGALQLVLVVVILVLAAYSQITYHGWAGTEVQHWDTARTSAGETQFRGEVTGYEVVLYGMAVPAAAFLWFVGYRKVAVAVAAAFVAARLYSPWTRAAAVTMLVTMGLCVAWTRHRPFSRAATALFALGALGCAVLLQLRGHTSIREVSWDEIGARFRERGVAGVIGSRENEMFLVSAAEMYLTDGNGFNLGAGLLSSLAVKPIPRRVFPELKSQLEAALDIHVLGSGRRSLRYTGLINTFPGYVGSLYRIGWILAVVLGMYGTGRGVRLVETMLEQRGRRSYLALLGVVTVGIFPGAGRFVVDGLPGILLLNVGPLVVLILAGRWRLLGAMGGGDWTAAPRVAGRRGAGVRVA